MLPALVARFSAEWTIPPVIASESSALSLVGEIAGRSFDSFEAVMHDSDMPSTFFVYAPEGASFRVSQTRVIRDHALALSGDDARAYFFLLRADALTTEAANSLLKVFEDVPEGICFVLVTDRPEALLPTVRSRCFFLDAASDIPDTDTDLAAAIDAYVAGNPAPLLFELADRKVERDEAIVVLHRAVSAMRRPGAPSGLAERVEEWLALLRTTTVSPRNVLDSVFLA